MRFNFIIAIIVACAAGAADAGSDQGATAPPAEVVERLKAELSPDADQVISIFGALRSPQTITPAKGLTVTKAIAMAGGFSDFANRRKVGVWKRKEGRYFTVNVRAVIEKKADAEDPPLNAGDVVIINQVLDYF